MDIDVVVSRSQIKRDEKIVLFEKLSKYIQIFVFKLVEIHILISVAQIKNATKFRIFVRDSQWIAALWGFLYFSYTSFIY